MEIAEIKTRLSMGEVLSYYGLRPNRNAMLNCPFHPDRTPSMQVYPKTDTAYCFSSNCPTHGKSLDVIEFILHKEGVSKQEAIRKAQTLIGGPEAHPAETLTRSAVLLKMFAYFKNAVPNSKPAQDYIKLRNLDPQKLEIGYNSGQFHHAGRSVATVSPDPSVTGRSKASEALIRSCLKYGLLLDKGQRAKTGEKAYSPFGKNGICFALRNRDRQIVSLYFRSIVATEKSAEAPRHFYLKNRQGLYPCYPKPDTKKLILTESIIDAIAV